MRPTQMGRRTIKRFKSTWAELDYAQRRLLEMRTGVSMTQPAERSYRRGSIDELEAWFALELGNGATGPSGSDGPDASRISADAGVQGRPCPEQAA